jgi:hypothetical protein
MQNVVHHCVLVRFHVCAHSACLPVALCRGCVSPRKAVRRVRCAHASSNRCPLCVHPAHRPLLFPLPCLCLFVCAPFACVRGNLCWAWAALTGKGDAATAEAKTPTDKKKALLRTPNRAPLGHTIIQEGKIGCTNDCAHCFDPCSRSSASGAATWECWTEWSGVAQIVSAGSEEQGQ